MADTVRAGCTRRAGAAAECSDAEFVALDRAGIEAAPPQHAGDRPTSSPASLGRFSRAVAPISRESSPSEIKLGKQRTD